jgi:glycosyltransferase involved in cell wall biosynthesis
MNQQPALPRADHLFLCSNKWFSAVSDYCLQLIRFTSESSESRVQLAAPEWSPLRTRLPNPTAQFIELPIYPKSLSEHLASWRGLTKLLTQRRSDRPLVVWTFEGREQTLCALHRLVNRKLWNNVRLVRVRGQDSATKSNIINRWLYRSGTDKIVFAAEVVRSRTAFAIPPERTMVHHYCAKPLPHAEPTQRYDFVEGVPPIDFNKPLVLVLGRFDPVKGHESVLQAFARLAHEKRLDAGAQLVLIGRSQNLQAVDLHRRAVALLGEGRSAGTRHYAASPDGRFQIYLFDEQLAEAPLFVHKAHLGLISSLGSEVICRVAVEFLQAGTPILSTDVGALPEVLAKAGMPTYPAGNVDALTTRLYEALSRTANPATLAQLRAETAKLGEQFYHLMAYNPLIQWVLN